MQRLERTTRSSELNKLINIGSGDQTSNSHPLLSHKDIKVRKWRRVMVRLGQLKIPRWVPEQEVIA